MVLNGLLAQCGTTGDAALRLIGKKNKSRRKASQPIGKFSEWRTRKAKRGKLAKN